MDLAAPFHILNTTLNVVKGGDLGLQSRKGMSFIFTPFYSGFDLTRELKQTAGDEGTPTPSDPRVRKYPAYRTTASCSLHSPYPGARLGTAMAISGAAASPNMGYYTSGAVSFLLTVFSVRLGWWMGNPRFKDAWESGHPRSSWQALVRELTGIAANGDSVGFACRRELKADSAGVVLLHRGGEIQIGEGDLASTAVP